LFTENNYLIYVTSLILNQAIICYILHQESIKLIQNLILMKHSTATITSIFRLSYFGSALISAFFIVHAA